METYFSPPEHLPLLPLCLTILVDWDFVARRIVFICHLLGVTLFFLYALGA